MRWLSSINKLPSKAFIISVILHIAILSVFAMAKFSAVPKTENPRKSAQAKIAAVKKIIEQTAVLPKPKITAEELSIKGFTTEKNNAISRSSSTREETAAFDEFLNSEMPVAEKAGTEMPTFFSSVIDKKKICFVVDCSGSMKGLINTVKNELKKSITALEPDCYFEIILFGNNELKFFGTGNKLTRASMPAKQKAFDFIAASAAEGQTNAAQALKTALLSFKNEGKPDIICFLTDGFELGGVDSSSFAKKILEIRNSHCSGTKINTIGFYPSREDKIVLITLAQSTGGDYSIVRN